MVGNMAVGMAGIVLEKQVRATGPCMGFENSKPSSSDVFPQTSNIALPLLPYKAPHAFGFPFSFPHSPGVCF